MIEPTPGSKGTPDNTDLSYGFKILSTLYVASNGRTIMNYDMGKMPSGLENQDYGRRGSAALTMRHPPIRKSWH
jgi:hypothetical protein